MATYTALDGALRLYDSAETPFYVQMKFDELNLSGVEGRARPEETAIFHRGRGDTDTHYISGPDTPVLEPVEISYSFRLQNVVADHDKLLAAHSNPRLASPWAVDGDTWTTTKGDFSLTNGAGSSFTDPAFADSSKQCVNVEILWTRGGVAIGRKYGAVYFSAEGISLAEAEDGVILTATGQCYGLITTITAFTSGTES